MSLQFGRALPSASGVAAAKCEQVLAFLLRPSQHLPSVSELTVASDVVLEAVQADGLRNWILAVRLHHNATFQHCLLVNGVTAAFALSLGFSAADRRRLMLASVLHDIGKTEVPIAILECPEALTPHQISILRQHPRAGFDRLSGQAGLEAEVLDAVLHHHEFLDGTGYPDRLAGAEIGDLCRLLTIADVFSALIEVRAYKPALSSLEALSVMTGMAGKLDPALLLAFTRVVEHMGGGLTPRVPTQSLDLQGTASLTDDRRGGAQGCQDIGHSAHV